eukprot:COSAG06_NODE_2189_length_7384_cov_1.396980_6_plen_201_part_00
MPQSLSPSPRASLHAVCCSPARQNSSQRPAEAAHLRAPRIFSHPARARSSGVCAAPAASARALQLSARMETWIRLSPAGVSLDAVSALLSVVLSAARCPLSSKGIADAHRTAGMQTAAVAPNWTRPMGGCCIDRSIRAAGCCQLSPLSTAHMICSKKMLTSSSSRGLTLLISGASDVCSKAAHCSSPFAAVSTAASTADA